jgi:uncharacterized protein involved in exopolysaccharide biosynthesis
MRLLSSGPDDPMNGLVHDERPVFPTIERQPYVLSNGSEEQDAHLLRVNVFALLRRYWLLGLSLLIVGAAAGFASIVLSSPMYKTLLLIEVQSTNSLLPQSAGFQNTETSEVDIQTQVNILRSETFLRRGEERMQSETVALAPTGRDIFSRLRQRIHPAIQDTVEPAARALC